MTTYYAHKEYIYDNGDTIFSIPFSYIKPEHIVVLINGEDTKNYTYLNTTQIRVTETLNKGDKITIARTTPIDSRMVIFSDTSILDKDVQNLAQTQTFNAVQEIYDNNEVFKIETNDNLAANKQELENIIENNKQEILGIQSSFENEVNTKIEEVSNAAEKINKLEESVNTAVTAANTASEKADSAANEAAKAKTEVDNAKVEVTKATEQANIAASKANEATEIVENSLANIESKTQEEINKIKQTGFYMQNDKLYYIDSNGETKEFKSGSSGLEVCDIGMSLFVDETKGLRRRLNGQIVDINTNTQVFLNRLLQVQTTNPEYFTTEENWQAESLLSIDSCVYKFVLNYSGDNVVSVRLPKYPDYVEINAGGTLPVIGNGMSLGLTINGTDTFYAMSGLDWNGSDPNRNSVMKWSSIGGVLPRQGSQISIGTNNLSLVGITNDPTKSGIQTTLKQIKLKMRYFIQIATGVETEVNIKDTLELNNPFTFGMNMYFKGEMENISWLKSAGQQNPKALYPDFYNWVLANANAGKDGFKLSTASGITDYDFVVNTTDETFRLPLKNGMEGIFANGVKGNGELGVTTNTYPTSSGYVNVNAGYALSLRGITAGVDSHLIITTDASKSGMVVDTTVPTGYSLYYYVGVVVNNEGLINAGRINEQLSGLVEVGGSLGMPSNKYVNLTLGASGDSYTAPANGWFYLSKVAGSDWYFAQLSIVKDGATLFYVFVDAYRTSPCTVIIPVKKGDNVVATYNATGVTQCFRFIYAVGDV